MLDSKTLREAEMYPAPTEPQLRLAFSSYSTYNDSATDPRDIATWLGRIADEGFMKSFCKTGSNQSKCIKSASGLKMLPAIDMNRHFDYKLLPVIDGDSPNRLLAVIRSMSVPITATFFTSWHDARITPWLHFVPMDKSFVDMYGNLDYSLGNGKAYRGINGDMVNEGAHDEAAKQIAAEGRWWAEKVMRQENIRFYMLRLLLEHVRLCSDDPEQLNYVGDLEGDTAF
jgi:hypothetical protein